MRLRVYVGVAIFAIVLAYGAMSLHAGILCGSLEGLECTPGDMTCFNESSGRCACQATGAGYRCIAPEPDAQ
jgi:hypothetical protein